jgi:biopolymer transport protein TolR
MAGGSLYDDEEGGGIISDINVTPLVDITLVLLIIFMVTARLIVNRGIPGVQPPKAASGEEVKSTLALTIDKERALYVNGQKQKGLPEVGSYLRAAVTQNPEIQAVITADNTVPYGDFVSLIDVIRLAGVQKYALTVTEKAPPPPPPQTPAPVKDQ